MESKEDIFVECEGAELSQPYAREDLLLLLRDLPLMITDYQTEKKDSVYQIRLTAKQKLELENNTASH